MSQEKLSLLAYLDQESAGIAHQWRETPGEVQLEFIDWLEGDMASDSVPDEWRAFASRLSLAYLQAMAAKEVG